MVKVRNIAYVSYDVTDLDRTERFLHHFGMRTQHKSDGVLYMRAVDDANYVYVAHQAESRRLRSIALEAPTRHDLEEISHLPGASEIEPMDSPGGGERVRLTGPEGLQFELVYGVERVRSLPSRRAFKPNFASDMQRINQVVRIEKGATDIRRISHVALQVRDVQAAVNWMIEQFGFLASDYLEDPDGPGLVAAFLRPDCGPDLVDHHVVALAKHHTPGIHHSSFWVEDFDALFNGADHLAAQGYVHEHGIGRHGAGSQVFSYWRDPDDFMIERFTDGDVFDSTVPPHRQPASNSAIFQWGPQVKPSFFE